MTTIRKINCAVIGTLQVLALPFDNEGICVGELVEKYFPKLTADELTGIEVWMVRRNAILDRTKD